MPTLFPQHSAFSSSHLQTQLLVTEEQVKFCHQKQRAIDEETLQIPTALL